MFHRDGEDAAILQLFLLVTATSMGNGAHCNLNNSHNKAAYRGMIEDEINMTTGSNSESDRSPLPRIDEVFFTPLSGYGQIFSNTKALRKTYDVLFWSPWNSICY